MEQNEINAGNAGLVNIGDLTVNRIGLGTNRITDTEAARAVLRRAFELGVNFIDTADFYQKGASEQTIGATFDPYPKGLVIGTKGGMSWSDGSAINDPAYLRNALDASLKRLKRDYVDLYQLHRTDPKVPIEETAGVLKSMKDQGKARHIGLSEVTVEQIERYRAVVEIISVQNQYNILERKHESVLEYCEANGITFIPWYPLAKNKLGLLTIEKIAEAYNATPTQIAIAWLLGRSPVMLPIPGTLSVDHLESNIAAAKISLSEDEMKELNSIDSPPRRAARL
jgi:aryl-alcohol dehydrogenase-like predicted oxidoreductase